MRSCRKVAGSGYPEAGFGWFDSNLDGQQAQPAEFKHALVGKVIAGTQGDFVMIVLLEHPGDGGPFIVSRRRNLHHLLSVTHLDRIVSRQSG